MGHTVGGVVKFSTKNVRFLKYFQVDVGFFVNYFVKFFKSDVKFFTKMLTFFR